MSRSISNSIPPKSGAVVLEDRLQAGLGYTAWDGVTIVLLKVKP